MIKNTCQFSYVTQLCPTLCDPMNHSTPGLPVHHQLWSSLKLMSIESVMLSSHLILCCPLRLLPPIPPSIRVFSNESTLRMRLPKYLSLSFSISHSNEHPGMIYFRMDWLDLLASKNKFHAQNPWHSWYFSKLFFWNSWNAEYFNYFRSKATVRHMGLGTNYSTSLICL